MAVKLPNPKYVPKPYEQMSYPGQRGRIDVKFVPAVFLRHVVEKFPYEITAMRGLRAKKAIEPFIEEFQDKMYTTISTNANCLLDNTTEVLMTYLKDRREYHENMMQTKEQDTAAKHHDKFDVLELNGDLAYLESKKEALK